jgi:hypothetical protein
MAVFRWRHFAGEIILWAVRWYCRYGIIYRELEEMMSERGVAVEKRSAWYCSRLSFSWRVDETYVRAKGCWKYLYRCSPSWRAKPSDLHGRSSKLYATVPIATMSVGLPLNGIRLGLKVSSNWLPGCGP